MIPDDPTSPLDALLKLPAAVATELGAALPRLAERTRAQVDFAATLLEKLRCGDLGSRLSALAPNVSEHLADVVPFEPRTALRKASGDAEVIEVTTVAAKPRKPAPAKTAAAKKAPTRKAPAKKAAAPKTASAPEAASLAIPGYDALAASQVVPRLESLSGADLEAVRQYELAGRGRRTILSRIAQLQAG